MYVFLGDIFPLLGKQGTSNQPKQPILSLILLRNKLILHYVLFKQVCVAEEKVGEEGWGGGVALLAGFKSFQLFEKSLFKKIFACTADFWQCNSVLFQKLC